MKIGIHHTKGTFSERWIAYCEQNAIDYKIVNCYDSDIVHQLADCDALMWHFNHKDSKDSKFAKQLLFALYSANKKVFPDYKTIWHFDDKVGQKYLLEALDVPLVPSYVFYSKNEALSWLDKVSFPKVFKLRNGAGSDNVKLVKNKSTGKSLVKKSFGKGFKQYDAWSNLKERYRKYRLGKTTLWNVMKGVLRIFHTTEYARVTGNEVGYVYFQDFIPENTFDIRVIVIGNKAFAIKRLVRDNDFRASGSGYILYEKEHFDDEIISLSFRISDKIDAQCVAYDYVFSDGKPLIVEISYGFAMVGYDPCPGYWDKSLNWHEGTFDPYGWMVDDLLLSIEKNN
ncbi:MAG: hypothetical protein JW717_12910 [Marinilabiliaceae bacterium]|nr:hypothetical protein [Marinilabiliaceae bacterium]